MNTYYIEVILHSGTTSYSYDRQVRAKSMEVKSQGCYCFYGEDNKPVAYYPIANTIISSIDYAE